MQFFNRYPDADLSSTPGRPKWLLIAAMALPLAPAAAQPEITLLSADAQQALAHIRATHDQQSRAFVVIDKKAAQLHVFDARGALRGSTPVLLGLATGDDSVPGIGDKPLASVRPTERTTPAGRFVSEPGRNLQGDDIVWIDYDAAVSIHRVRTGSPGDRRLARLATPTTADNRISYGCVNVPAAFYDALIKPSLGSAQGLVYVLPETRPVATLWTAGSVRR